MSWDLSKFGNCPIHGHHAGSACPLCDANHTTPAALPPPAPEEPARDRSSWWAGPETELHDIFATWLEHHEVEGIHSRTDQKSTIEAGWPDFTCLKAGPDGLPLVCMVEFKNRTGKLRQDQEKVIARLRARSLPVLVTGDFREACNFVKNHLGICAPPAPSPVVASENINTL